MPSSPLGEGRRIISVHVLPPVLVPDTPTEKNSIVDVRCMTDKGESFIVEMQLFWVSSFKQRVLFNASKVYSSQLKSGETYAALQNVYTLCLVNDIFEPDLTEYYHVYNITHELHPDKVIEGFQFVFIELPKFLRALQEGRLEETELSIRNLWLRFFTEIDEMTQSAPVALLDNPETNKALGIVEESALTEGQRMAYDRFKDNVRIARELNDSVKNLTGKVKETTDALNETKAELNDAKAELNETIRKLNDSADKIIRFAKFLKQGGMPIEDIQKETGLSRDEIEAL